MRGVWSCPIVDKHTHIFCERKCRLCLDFMVNELEVIEGSTDL